MPKYQLLDKDGHDVLGGAVEADNVYIKTYGNLLADQKTISELAVGESSKKEYKLSGMKATVYTVLRVE